jgi:hypothetical protein
MHSVLHILALLFFAGAGIFALGVLALALMAARHFYQSVEVSAALHARGENA